MITRPARQAAGLCRLFEAEGAAVTRFPAIDIQPLADARAAPARPAAIDPFDLIIFASANAVRFGAWLLQGRPGAPLAAIGPATARALNEAGYPVSVQPAEGFDSESLLRHPRLASLAGTRLLLIKGQGGRELLEHELTRRGARLTQVAVYRRECPTPAPHALRDLETRFEGDAIHLITATSAEIVDNLLALATPALRARFDSVHWLVPSARVAERLDDGGVKGSILRADSAEDHDLVSAAVRWRSSVSGA